MKEGEIMSIDLIVFTDGSAQIGKPQYGGYSCIFVDPKKYKFSVLYDNINSDKIPYLELLAIYKAIYHSNEIRKSYGMKTIKILIISDHRNHVEALNNWIWNVWDTTTDTWKKKNGDIVSNQNVFKDIISILEKGKVQIKIVHIRSHLKSNKTDIKAFCNDMKDKGVYLNPYTAKVFIKFNQIADVYAKYGSTYYTKKYNKSPIKLR
jgi:ribonuclease HI